jgi:hypothetical protein
MQPDTVRTVIFWGSVMISGIGALFTEGPRLMREVWRLTNGPKSGRAEYLLLTGKEWLSWPLEKKQTLVASHLTDGLGRMGIQEEYSPENVSPPYIASIDETAAKYPDDPRMNQFITTFIQQIGKKVQEEFKHKQPQN